MSDIPPEVVERVSDLAEFFGADDLDDELLDYAEYDDNDNVVCIKHPLVFSIFHMPLLNRQCNASLKAKREAIIEYRDAGDWWAFIVMHERPYRIDALLDIAADVDDCTWWSLVAKVWTDSENIREFPEAWPFILRESRAMRHCMMDEDERQEYDALPAVLDVYQGCTDQRDDGWSWTTKRSTAEWFANRFAQMEDAQPRLRQGRINKGSITAYLTRRNEYEVIVAPELVDVVSDVTNPKRK